MLFLVVLAAASLLSAVPSGEALAGTRAYIANITDGTVSVVDASSRTVIATIPISATSRPGAVAAKLLNPTHVYVANNIGNSVSVIETASNTVVATIPVGAGAGPSDIALNAAATRAYVANFGNNTVSVIDTTTNTLVTNIAVGAGPSGVAVHPDDARVYVANRDANTVQVIDTSTNTVTTTISGLGGSPIRIALTPQLESRAYVPNIFNNSVSVIDTVTATVVATIPVPGNEGSRLEGIAINPSGTQAFVSNLDDNTVTPINIPANTVGVAVSVGTFPSDLAWRPDGLEVWVTNGDPVGTGDSVSIVETETNTVAATLILGNGPSGIAFIRTTPTINCCWSVTPSSILEWQTTDVTINGTNFEPGITADFGFPIEVQSVEFVSSTQIIARIYAAPGGIEGNQQGNAITVQNRDGGSFTITSAPFFTIVRDTDGDGVGNAQDSCPTDFNPNQAEAPCNYVVAVLDGTTTTSTTTPVVGEPNFHQVCATFPGDGVAKFIARLDDRTVHVHATSNGQPLDRRVPESVVMVIPDSLEFTDGATDIERCYVTDLSQQFAVPPGATVTLETKYHNFAQPIGVQLTDPRNPSVTVPLLIAEIDFPTTVLNVQSGPAVQTVGGTLAVNPTTWNILWETNPTTGTAVFTLSALTDGAVVTQVIPTSLLFEGTLEPTSTAFVGDTLKITVNKTDLLLALRKRVVSPFTNGQVERILLTGRLMDGRVLSVGVDIVLHLPLGLIDELIADVEASNLDIPTKSSLLAKLRDAREGFLKGQLNRACAKMADFIKEVTTKRGKGIPTALADDWIARGTAFRTILECS